MKFTIFSLIALSSLAAASPPPNKVVLIPIEGDGSAGCWHYPVRRGKENCCLPRLCKCRDGHFYLFNSEKWKTTMNGCDPPWMFMGKKVEDIEGYCCQD